MALTADQLPALDPDDPRSTSVQIAAVLRNVITSGAVAPGERLPGQGAIAERYGVARETVKRGIERLTAEGRILSRQGSGVFVRQTPDAPPPGAPELEALREDLGRLSGNLEGLRAELRRTTDEFKRTESRIDDLLNAWEAHGVQSTADGLHPQ